jgi:hypothetical protein
MTSFNKIDNCINTIGCLLNTDNCNGWGEEQVRAIEALGMNLHALMVTGDKEGKKVQLDPLAYPSRDALVDLAYSDSSPLHRFIHCLLNGEHLEDASWSNKKHEKVVQTTFGVKETICSLRSTNPGALKDIIGAQMLAQNVLDSVFELLNEYVVAPGKGVIVKTDKGVVTMKLSEGLTNIMDDPYSLVIDYYDNLGFKQRGRRIGYKQYTKQIHVVITREELIALGIYPDPSNPEKLVKSREHKKWSLECLTHGFEDVCAPGPDGTGYDDFNCLAETVLQSVESLVKLVSKDKLPLLTAAQELLESCNVDWPDNIPDNYGARMMVDDAT